ncbi:response regulator [Calditrichota bacterium]
MNNILYIDDNHEATLLADIYLKKNGYTVFTVKNTEDARIILKNETIDIIITDVGLPGESGPEFYRVLKKDVKFKQIPFIFVSGHAMGYDKSLLKERQHFLQKPIFFPDLVKMIKSMID